jgi:hypothetical protein
MVAMVAMLMLYVCTLLSYTYAYAYEELPIAAVRLNLTQGATLAQQQEHQQEQQQQLEQELYGLVGQERTAMRRKLAETGTTGLMPLFEGLGTHYSFVWVGSPAQRVSVIMDTGSHHTAFPCVGKWWWWW